MVEMREQFENLPRVKPILRLVKYSESSGGYDPLDQKSIYEKYADWLNGAWYVFQDQQKKIDGALKELELLNYHRTGNSDNAIKILKGTEE